MKVEPFYMCHKYKIWVIYLKSYLLDILQLKLSALKQQYEIGRLLALFIGKDIDENGALLMEKNKQFFIIAKEIINNKNSGETAVADEQLIELTQLATDIVALINKIHSL